MLTEYVWCVVVAAIFCFTLGFGMGANDVANNFGTSVGSKSISLRKALIIAGIFELVGSVGLGASVTDSIRSGVYRADSFGDMPDFMLLANLTALICSTVWLILASVTGMTVSTTHSIVGSMIGCGLAVGGRAVQWAYIGRLFAGWVIGPLCSMIIGALYFTGTRQFVMRAEDPVRRGFQTLWALLLVLCCSCTLFFTFSNPVVLSGKTCSVKDKTTGGWKDETPCTLNHWVQAHPGIGAGIALGAGAVLTGIVAPLLYMWAKKKVKAYDLKKDDTNETTALEEGAFKKGGSVVSGSAGGSVSSLMSLETDQDVPKGCKVRAKEMWEQAPWNQDLHAEVYESKPEANELMLMAEKFDARCEQFFGALQTISAAVACMVHGSNDVSNAAAPFASVYSIYVEGQFLSHVSVPVWILVVGGCAISVGLMVLGYRVIKRVGIELCYVSACRGFCIEMALSTVMLVASFLGFSVSTTHVMIGAMIGVGLMDKHIDPATGIDVSHWTLGFLNFRSINWRLAGKFAVSWVLTFILCATGSALLFSFAIYSPTKIGRFTACTELNGC